MTFIDTLFDSTQPLIIGEIGQNHDGSLGQAHAYIDALADAGADAVKFQTHIAAEESTLDEAFRVKFSKQDATRYDYWQRMEFTAEGWAGLKAHADARGIGFLSTPFSLAAVELLEGIGVEAWKIGSGDTQFTPMIDAILATQKPLIVSSGMSDWAELDAVVGALKGHHFSLMQCTSNYPTPLEKVGLNNLQLMRDRYGCRIGLSDHSGKTAPSLAAIARGFSLIEVHATFDKRMFGPDVPASLSIEEIGALAQFARDVALMDANPVEKDALAAGLAPQKALFGRSLALSRDLPEGHLLREEDVTLKKPGGGLPWDERGNLVGKALARDVACNRLLTAEDIKQ
jgi:N,N'-diacetyllegionaminate synthase